MKSSYSRALLLIIGLALAGAGADALPNIVSRATDSIAALLASGRQQQGPQQSGQLQVVAAQPQVAAQQVVAPKQQESARGLNGSLGLSPELAGVQSQPSGFPTQLRQANLQPANATGSGSAAGNQQAKYGNVLEVLSNVGKAIHQQILGASSNNQFQIVASPAAAAGGLVAGLQQPEGLANTKKNEYQSIVVSDDQKLNLSQLPAQASSINATNYKEQGELLRQEIVRRASQLQQVVASSMEVLKNNGDLIVRRLLEQMNHRLDQAKLRAEKIINEPATSEVATRALFTINQGLNNLNNIITNIVNRLDVSSKEAIQQQLGSLVAASQQQQQPLGPQSQLSRSGSAPGSTQIMIDPNRLRQNLQQLGQQFSSAISAAQQQRFSQQTRLN